MSGVDEQGVPPCGCDNFVYWIIYSRSKQHMGYLNSDKWIEKDYTMGVNRTKSVRGLSKDAFIDEIETFRCSCDKAIRIGDGVFDRLCSSVRTRWDIGRVGDR